MTIQYACNPARIAQAFLIGAEFLTRSTLVLGDNSMVMN